MAENAAVAAAGQMSINHAIIESIFDVRTSLIRRHEWQKSRLFISLCTSERASSSISFFRSSLSSIHYCSLIPLNPFHYSLDFVGYFDSLHCTLTYNLLSIVFHVRKCFAFWKENGPWKHSRYEIGNFRNFIHNENEKWKSWFDESLPR